MKYNLKNRLDVERFNARCKLLISQECSVELTKMMPNRTKNQNRYLHLILNYFAIETGYSMHETKQVLFKQLVNKDLFVSEFIDKATGEAYVYFKSTTELDTKEMTTSIDRFRNWAVHEGGIYLPAPNEYDYLAQIEIEIDRYNI